MPVKAKAKFVTTFFWVKIPVFSIKIPLTPYALNRFVAIYMYLAFLLHIDTEQVYTGN